MNNYIVWNIDPVIANIGPLQLRYYGILFVISYCPADYLIQLIYCDRYDFYCLHVCTIKRNKDKTNFPNKEDITI